MWAAQGAKQMPSLPQLGKIALLQSALVTQGASQIPAAVPSQLGQLGFTQSLWVAQGPKQTPSLPQLGNEVGAGQSALVVQGS